MIFKSMMKDSATLVIDHAPDSWRKKENAQRIDLAKVHFQRTAGVKMVNGGDERNMAQELTAVLFYAPDFSMPRGLDLMKIKRDAEAAGDVIAVECGGEKYELRSIVECKRGGNKINHYEARLA